MSFDYTVASKQSVRRRKKNDIASSFRIFQENKFHQLINF